MAHGQAALLYVLYSVRPTASRATLILYVHRTPEGGKVYHRVPHLISSYCTYRGTAPHL